MIVMVIGELMVFIMGVSMYALYPIPSHWSTCSFLANKPKAFCTSSLAY